MSDICKVMKKILIVNNNMQIGGVQKSLVNLLHAIHNQYDVTLMLFSLTGEYLNDIPKDVTVVPVKSHYKYLGLSMKEARRHPFTLVGRCFYSLIAKTLGRKSAVALMNVGQEKITGFDAAISFLHNAKSKSFYGGCNDFVLNCVDAPRKITFLHCDYVKCGAHTAENAKQYARFDIIAACSDGCRNVFVGALPELAEKTVTVQNCHNFSSIRALADQAPVVMDPTYINVVTVARLSYEKGVLRAIEAIAALGDERKRIRYYIVGNGSQQEQIEQRITELNVSHIVTLCGALANPYGHMKAADLLLIPSYEEAAPMVIDEAASLGTPILSTLTSSAEDMIMSRGLGWVCENSTEGITSKLKCLLQHPDTMAEQKRKMLKAVYSNDEAMAQFKCMVG